MLQTHGLHRWWQAATCLLLALMIPVLGNRSAVAYLNSLCDDHDDQFAGPVSQLEPRDRKPKPTRQQMRARVDKESWGRIAHRRPASHGTEHLPCTTSLIPPVRGQRTIAMARNAAASPCYMKVYESPQTSLAPPG